MSGNILLRIVLLVTSATFLTVHVMSADGFSIIAFWGVLSGYWLGALIHGDDL